MKISLLLSILLLTGIFFSSCNTAKKTTDKQQPTDKKLHKIADTYWKLVEVNGKAVHGLEKEPFVQLNSFDKRIFGTGGCNSFSGGYELNEAAGQIKFSQIAATQMACLDMTVEDALYKILGETDNFTIVGATLSFNKEKVGSLAKFVAIEAHALNGTWELNHISGSSETMNQLFPNGGATISFNVKDNAVSGNSGCNNYNSQIKLDGNAIDFGPVASTRMACSGNGEPLFFKILETINKYSVSSDKKTLTLIVGDIAVMRFVKK